MKREEGYYWVRKEDHKWFIARYSCGYWDICGWEYSFEDDYFTEINEYRIKPPQSDVNLDYQNEEGK